VRDTIHTLQPDVVLLELDQERLDNLLLELSSSSTHAGRRR
jgi:pheromone shutdown protein TraB